MSNKFIYDYSNLLSDKIGSKNGIDIQEFDNLKDKFNEAFKEIFEEPNAEFGAIEANLNSVNIEDIKNLAKKIRANCTNFVVLGIGGSSLGSAAIFQALAAPQYNQLPPEVRGGPRFFVVDSVAPASFLGLLNSLDLEDTIFCVVSKSGRTTETMTQFFFVRDLCKERFSNSWQKHFVVLTDDTDNYLNNYATNEELDKLFIPKSLGGRYSVLSAVGLLPAAVLNFDIDKMLLGAREMLKVGKNRKMLENAPFLSAGFNYLNYKKGKNMAVMVPYSDMLSLFDDWFCQLWGESIGRDLDKYGEKLVLEARVGQTPIKVTGPSAQHSQFQLYLEGPDDKIFTFIGIENFVLDAPLPMEVDKLFGAEVAENRTFGDLLNIERRASTQSLVHYQKPSETILIECLDEEAMGKLFMFFILKMMFTGVLLDINPFGQPAVESIKKGVFEALKGAEFVDDGKKIEV